jgi:hypothetical protein
MSVLSPRIHTRSLNHKVPPQSVHSTRSNEETLKAGGYVSCRAIGAHDPPLK